MSELWPESWRPKSLDDQWDIDKSPPFVELKTYQPYWFDRPGTAREWIETTQRFQAWLVRVTLDAMRRRADVIVHAPVFYAVERLPGAYQMGLVDYARRPKPAYYEVADAHSPLAVNIDMLKTRYFVGDRLDARFWVFNDPADVPKNARIAWQVLDGQEVLFKQSAPARIEPLAATYQGTFEWTVPGVEARKKLGLRLALLDADGKVLHDHSAAFEIFPKAKPLDPAISVYQIGNLISREQMAAMGLREAGQEEADVILASDLEALTSRAASVGARVLQGAGLIAFDAAPIPSTRNFEVAGVQLRRMMGPDPTMFVSRMTGHAGVASFSPGDFSNWYYPKLGRTDWLYRGVGFEPTTDSQAMLVTTDRLGNKINIVGEYAAGKGRVIAASLYLGEAVIESNPVAWEFVQRLIQTAAGN